MLLGRVPEGCTPLGTPSPAVIPDSTAPLDLPDEEIQAKHPVCGIFRIGRGNFRSCRDDDAIDTLLLQKNLARIDASAELT